MAKAAAEDATVSAKVPKLVEALQSAADGEYDTYNQVSKNELTALIQSSDIARGRYFQTLCTQIRGYKNYPGSEKYVAAEALLYLVKHSGIYPRMQRDQETLAINDLVDSLKSDDYAGYVTLLGLDEVVEALSSANSETRSLMYERTQQKAAHVVGAAKTARTQSNDAYRNLVQMVDSLATNADDDDYSDFIGIVNAEIAQFKRYSISSSTSSSGEVTAEDSVSSTDASSID